ncbi:transporter substrate-binding domain-containing protein [Paucibacter sp. O1-1]|nr:transporter substrate-binding domain-containing protein [Paucibacter sp. O1-1]MDA3826708.1 transporter substrate-binding domain-containing protein [Paucibacter sp. O1-1]
MQVRSLVSFLALAARLMLLGGLLLGGLAALAEDRPWLTAEERAWIAQQRVLRVASTPSYGPFTFVDAEGRLRGLSVDYVSRLNELSGLRLEFVAPEPFARNMEALRAGELDLLMSLRETPERAEFMGFTRPYVSVPVVLLRRVGSERQALMPGEPVSVGQGFAAADFLRQRYPDNPQQVETDDKSMLRRLASGEIDAAVMDLASATFQIRGEGIGNLRVQGDVGYAYELGIGYRRELALLGRILDKTLARIDAAERQAMVDRWISLQAERSPWQRRLLLAAAAALALVLLGLGLVLLWNRALQRQVVARTEQLRIELAERQRLQAADHARALAEAANQAKTEFMSQASHELRTPLNAVLGFAQLLGGDAQHPLDALQRERVGHIDAAARHLLILIEDMMTLSRLESGSLAVTPLPLQAGPLLRRCVELARPAAASAGIELRLDEAPLPLAQADPVRLEQVLHNLLSNAIKYNRPGGWVQVRAWAEPARGLLIQVADNGLGLSAEQLSQLFQPFNRLGRSEQQGTGIGLVISKQLMERMGGQIRVESQAGQGSRFILELQAS